MAVRSPAARSNPTTLVKLVLALPHALIPDGVDAEWVSHRGETVEVCLAASSQSSGKRSALIWPDHRLTVPKDNPGLEVSAPLRYLYEPDGAVIRAGGSCSPNRWARPCSIARSPTSPVTTVNRARSRRFCDPRGPALRPALLRPARTHRRHAGDQEARPRCRSRRATPAIAPAWAEPGDPHSHSYDRRSLSGCGRTHVAWHSR